MEKREAAREERAGRDERDERILDVIRSLREGEVVTYGDIAADAGYPKLSRLVGRLLALGGTSDEADNNLDDSSDGPDGWDEELPWWRVVNSVGRLVPGNEREQAAQLRAEGVDVRDGRVRHAPIGRFRRRPG